MFLLGMATIILITSSSNVSGGSRQALYLALGLARRGHTVRFFVPERSTLPSLAPEQGFWLRFTGRTPAKTVVEASMPDPGRPCVVHAFHNAAVKALAWWGIFWKRRAVTVAHRGVIFKPKNPLPYWSPGIDRFLVNSRACARIVRGMGVSQKRIVYVPNCVPDSRLVPLQAPDKLRAALRIAPESFVFLCIGGNKPYKGTEQLLRAFALAFKTSGAARPLLMLVGQSPETWRALADELGISEQVRFTGRTEDIGACLALASAFVLPSLAESMPNTLLEALRAGLPAVGTEVGAVPDILTNVDDYTGPCGLLAPPGDVPALADAMRQLFNDTGLRERLAGAARKAGALYTPEKRLDRVEAVYSELLRRKGLI